MAVGQGAEGAPDNGLCIPARSLCCGVREHLGDNQQGPLRARSCLAGPGFSRQASLGSGRLWIAAVAFCRSGLKASS